MTHLVVDSSGEVATLTFSGSLTIQNAQAVKTALSEAVGKARALEVNLEAVEGVDLSGLQLLCATQRTLEAEGRTFTVRGSIPPIFSHIVDIAGFHGCAGDGKSNGLWTGTRS